MFLTRSAAPTLSGPARQRLSNELRAAIRRTKGSIRTLSERFGVNPKSIRRWKSRDSTEDRTPGPRRRRSSILSPSAQTMLLCARRFARLPLDDCLYLLAAASVSVSRASLQRFFRREQLSPLPRGEHMALPSGWFDVHRVHLAGKNG